MNEDLNLSFDLPDFEKNLVKLALTTPAPGKWCIANAIRNLNKAWQIKDIDPTMALFRCITSEEESATAIFHSLKRRKYPGAEILKTRNHLHKNAVIPFFKAISHVFVPIKDYIPKVELRIIENNEQSYLQIYFKEHPAFGPYEVHSPLPLEFKMFVNKKEYDFSNDLDYLATKSQFSSILDHLKDRANQRNKLLYASNEGFPFVQGEIEKPWMFYKQNTFLNLKIYLLIDPYKDHQLFVMQALKAFLKMLNLLPQDIGFD